MLLILIIAPIYYYATSNKAAAWFDENWFFRKSIDITNDTTEETNVYVSLTLDTSDTAKFQADCGDLRFTKYNGELMPYYIVSGCGTNSTVIHVNFDTFPAGRQTIFEYYGNPMAPNGFSASDFSNPATSYTVGSSGSEEKSPAPVAYWTFDEGQGSTAHDESVNRNDGTLGTGTSAPTWKPESDCVSGKCLSFDGGDFVQGTSPTFSGNFEGSYCAWVKLNNVTSSQAIITQGDTNGYQGFGMFVGIRGAGVISAEFYGNHPVYTDNVVSANSWNYICITKTVGTIISNTKIYLNGVSQTVSDYDYSIPNFVGTYPIYIGTDKVSTGSPTDLVNGSIDEPKIYPYARTAAQIKADYNAGLAGMGKAKTGSGVAFGDRSDKWMTDGLVGYWKMDESTGTAVQDYSGNDDNGTWFGSGTHPATGKFGNGGGFNGTDDRINGSKNLFSNQQDVNYTISSWFKTSASGSTQFIYSEGNEFVSSTTNTIGVQLLVNSTGKVGTGIYNGISQYNVVTSDSYNDGNWHYATLVRLSDATFNIYVDGILKKTGNPSNTYSAYWLNRRSIGVKYQSNLYVYFNGSIDETRVYNRALSPDEVQRLYNWAPGPVAHYKMDEKSGTAVYDASGNGNNGSLGAGSSAPTWTSGKYGSGLSFDGADDYISANSVPTSYDSPFTMTAWVKSNTSSDNHQIVCAGADVQFYQSGTSLNYKTTGDITAVGNVFSSGNINTWKFVSVTYNGSDISLYVDGVFKTSETKTATGGSNTTIGRYSSSAAELWNGSIDDVRIYNYARTQRQILEDMYAGQEGLYPVAHYDFNEGVGGTAYNSGYGGASLNGNLGTGSSAPTWNNDGKYGKALSFDGSNDYVSKSSPGITSKTITAWVKFTSSAGSRGIIFNNSTNFHLLATGVSGGRFATIPSTSASAGVETVASYNDDQWHFVAALRDTNEIYVDGVKAATQTDTNNYSNVDSDIIEIGRRSSGYPFQGSVDDVKIFNYALTPDDVRNEYNGGMSAQMGSSGSISGTGLPTNAASGEYCVPGDTTACAAPVGEWKMDEKTGTTAYDTSGNGLNGTIYNGAWANGKFGSGLNFSGTIGYHNGYAEIPYNASLDNPNAFTLSAWAKSSIAGSSYSSHGFIMDMGFLAGRGYGIFLESSTDKITGYYNNNATLLCDSVLDTNWHFYSLTYNGSTLILYQDGVQQGSPLTIGVGTIDDNPLRIGAESKNYERGWNGIIDNVRIYNYARTPAQIAWEYNKGKPMAEYRFNECQGGTIHDESGNANNGTINLGSSGSQTTTLGNGTCIIAGTTPWYGGRTGKYNGSLNFDGTDDYVSVGSTIPTVNAISLWIKPASTTQSIIDLDGGTHSIYISSGTVTATGFTSYYVDGNLNGTVSDTNWHQITAVSNTAFSTTTGFYIGRVIGIGYTYYSGQIDDVKIFNYALTADQVKTLYNASSVVNFGN